MDTKELEKKWHDDYYQRRGTSEYPSTLEEFREQFVRVHLTPFHSGGWSWWADIRVELMGGIGDLSGKRVLDYGCGCGELGVYLTSLGAEVYGFDLSAEGVKIARQTAARYHLRASFEPMDAESLGYHDNTFDFVVGFGVLHHVIKYRNASTELHRVLTPGGLAVFAETLWDNPFINFARRFTTEEDDAGDAKLTHASIREFAGCFSHFEVKERHFLYMLKRLSRVPIRDLSRPLRSRPIWKAVKRLDELLLRIPPLRSWCGEVIITLRK
jgi:2-polyprenyl-3-methyl-5-hydroxy-6-metoxy-1,4-benzoquinol methylase